MHFALGHEAAPKLRAFRDTSWMSGILRNGQMASRRGYTKLSGGGGSEKLLHKVSSTAKHKKQFKDGEGFREDLFPPVVWGGSIFL